MAATMSTQRAFTGVAQKAPSRARTVRVSCSKQGTTGQSAVQKVQTMAAAIAAAAMLQVSPVSAGVVLEQPQLKKVFQDDGTPAAPAPKKEIILPGMRSKAPKADAPKAAAPKKQEVSEQGGGLSPQALALPATIAIIGGGAFAWSKLDEDFEDFWDNASAKNSNLLGAGYETDIKGGNGVVAKKKGGATKVGTKKVKAAKSSSSPLGSIFGSKDD